MVYYLNFIYYTNNLEIYREKYMKKIVNLEFYKKNRGADNITLTIGIFLFRFLLDISYYKLIGPIFEYSGFRYSFNFSRYILSIFILMIFIPIIIRLNRKVSFSRITITVLVYISLVPFTTMVAFYDFEINFVIQFVIYWLILLITYLLFPKLKLVEIKKEKITDFVLKVIIFLFFITIIFISWRYTGFRITLDIFNVYDLRSEASSFKIPTLLSYIYAASKMINPVLIVYYMSIKKYKMTSFIVLIQLLSFSINGSKTVFFSTVLSIILYWIYNNRYILRLPWLLALIPFIGGIEYYIMKSYNIVNFIIRRVFFVPNLLNYYYYDFFSKNTPDYLKQSFLRHFGIESSYPPIDNLIGELYFNKPNMGANNGLFSEAYSNFGSLGLFIMPFIIVFAFKILDACAEGLDSRIFIVSSCILAFIFISSFFFTILLTHGFIALCLILIFLPRKT